MTLSEFTEADHQRARKNRARQRFVFWSAIAATVLLVTGIALLVRAWNVAPPAMSAEQHGDIRISEAHCNFFCGAPFVDLALPDAQDPKVQVSFTNIGSGSSVDDGKASLSYVISRLDNHEEADYFDQDLGVGQKATHGPVTVEVLAVYDELFDRNDAVDLRVTFDEDRLDEAP